MSEAVVPVPAVQLDLVVEIFFVRLADDVVETDEIFSADEEREEAYVGRGSRIGPEAAAKDRAARRLRSKHGSTHHFRLSCYGKCSERPGL